MKKYFILISILLSSLLSANVVTVYDLGTKGIAKNLVASYKYSPLLHKDQFDSFDITAYKRDVYIQRENTKGTTIFTPKKEIKFPLPSHKNPDYVVVNDSQNELYVLEGSFEDRKIIVYDSETLDKKYEVKIKKEDNISIAPNGIVYLQRADYTSKKTTIYKNNLTNYNQEWEKVLEKKGLLYIYCIPAANSFALMEQVERNGQYFMKFYNVDKSLHVSYLGIATVPQITLGKYVVYNDKAQPIFFDNKKIYTFKNGQLAVDRDFSNTSFDNITVEKNIIYGINH